MSTKVVDAAAVVVVSSQPHNNNSQTLTSTEPSSGGGIAGVSGDDEIGALTGKDDDDKKVVLDVSSSDAVVSSVSPAASLGVKIEGELLDSKSGTVVTETCDHDGGGDIVVQGLVDGKVSRDEKGNVKDKDEKILDVVSSIPTAASCDVKIRDDLLESKSESSDKDGGGDIVAQESVDGTKVSVDKKQDVKDNVKNLLDVSSLEDVVPSLQTSASCDVKIGDDLLESKSGAVLKETSDHDGESNDVVQDSVVEARVTGDELGVVTEKSELVLDKSISDAVVSSAPQNDRDVDTVSDSLGPKTEVLSADENRDGDIVVQDAVADSRMSEGEKENVKENIEKVSDEIEVSNEEKEGEYKATDIVWAKVKNYPWWPGQIFDPSSSTDKAKKYSNKKGFLVGYFGDQSFAWNKASNIKPFRKHFCKLEKQGVSKKFSDAVNCALDEVSRRVEFGLACSCISEEVRDKIKSQVFVNSGIKEEASKIDGGDRFSTVSSLKPVNVVQSLQDLARDYLDGSSRLEALSVRSQLLAFFRWKGYYQFQAENILDGPDNMLEDDTELPLTEENKVVEDEKPASAGKKVSSKKRKPDVCDSDDSVPHKKERTLTDLTLKGSSSVKGSKKNISKKAIVEDNVLKEEKGNENPASVGKKDSFKNRKPEVSDSDDSVPRKKERSLTDITLKSNSNVKRSKKDIIKNTTVEDNVSEEKGNERPASVGKKVSSIKKKPDACDSKKERSLTDLTLKGNSSVKRMKKCISKKETVEENVIKEEKGNAKPVSAGKKKSSKKRKPDVDSDDSVPHKKERSLTDITPKGVSSVKRSKKGISKQATVEDKKPSPKKVFRIGDSICKIAKQISESPSLLKKESEKSKKDGKSIQIEE